MYGCIRCGLLQSFDNQFIARLQATCDQPFVADGARCLQQAQARDVLVVDDQRGRIALLVVTHALLRSEDRIAINPFGDGRAHEHAGKRSPLGLGKIARRVTAPVV